MTDEYPDFHGDQPLQHAEIIKENCACNKKCNCPKNCDCTNCGCKICSKEICGCGGNCKCKD